jgi:hypothetical protein
VTVSVTGGSEGTGTHVTGNFADVTGNFGRDSTENFMWVAPVTCSMDIPESAKEKIELYDEYFGIDLVEKSENCRCYECEGSKIHPETGRVMNNFKHHTFLEACDECGTPKTKSLDLGRKGYYVCPECH